MRCSALRERFERTVGVLPGQLAEMLADIDEPTFGGSGAWLDESAPFENLLLALPLAAVDPPHPARLLAILHLGDDEASAHHTNYRPHGTARCACSTCCSSCRTHGGSPAKACRPAATRSSHPSASRKTLQRSRIRTIGRGDGTRRRTTPR